MGILVSDGDDRELGLFEYGKIEAVDKPSHTAPWLCG
jgi:hypothetical protein